MYVYVMAGPDISKVGIAKNVVRRFHQARTAKRGVTHIARVWWCPVDEREIERLACQLVGVPPSFGKEQFPVSASAMIDAVERAMVAVFGWVLPPTSLPWHVGGRPSVELLACDETLGPIISRWFGQPSKLDKKQQAQVRKWRKERHTVREIQAMVREEFGIDVSHALVHKYSAGLGRRRKPNKKT